MREEYQNFPGPESMTQTTSTCMKIRKSGSETFFEYFSKNIYLMT